jgi:CheY-like chemotaxis protein/anti-sigma regulatory factor (Ser/Thr protein kinase)
LLENEPGLSERARNYLETIQRAIEDVAHTVSRMREFYRQREPQLTLSPVDVNALVPQVIDLTRARWSDIPQQQGIVIRVETSLSAGIPAVMGSESELREALVNLVFNAVDSMPKGGDMMFATRVVEAGAFGTSDTGNRHIQIEVTDTGVGMDANTRERCLEPFFRTKGERGAGLGLAMVYGVLERHSGDIEIESELGKGTTVRLKLPVASEVVHVTGEVSDADVARSRHRVLIIDDDPVLLKSLRDILETDGHVVTAVGGGQAGIEAFRSAHSRGPAFDVVVTDLGMPHVDGRAVASAIKAASPSTPVILLTGWGAATPRRRGGTSSRRSRSQQATEAS